MLKALTPANRGICEKKLLRSPFVHVDDHNTTHTLQPGTVGMHRPTPGHLNFSRSTMFTSMDGSWKAGVACTHVVD